MWERDHAVFGDGSITSWRYSHTSSHHDFAGGPVGFTKSVEITTMSSQSSG